MLTINNIPKETKDIPANRREELYQFVHSLKLISKKTNTVKKEILSFSRIFLLFLCLVMLQFQSAFATSAKATDSISYLKIAELEYKDGQLFLLEHVKPVNYEDYEAHRLTLSAQESEQFLQLVKELKLLDMQSNDVKKKPLPPKKTAQDSKETVYSKEGLKIVPIEDLLLFQDVVSPPFEIEFEKNGKPGKVSAYRHGMSEAERQALESYIRQTRLIIKRRSKIRALLATFPDGEYRVKDWKRYAVYIGPKGWEPWAKRGNSIKLTNERIYVLNGKVVDLEEIEGISPDNIVSKNSSNGTEELIEAYGEQARRGVVIIETKAKN